MKAISVYALTREQNIHHLQKLERQLSERDYFLKIKEWELNSMKGLVKQLEGHMKEVYALRFFYSFQIPKLGKEFDLLQIKEDQILNLELKSGIVSDEAIRKQLIQNRYYLSVLGRTIRSYTYISSQNRLVRLTITIISWRRTGNSCVRICSRRALIIMEMLRICFRRALSDFTDHGAWKIPSKRIFSYFSATGY